MLKNSFNWTAGTDPASQQLYRISFRVKTLYFGYKSDLLIRVSTFSILHALDKHKFLAVGIFLYKFNALCNLFRSTLFTSCSFCQL